MRDYSLPHQIQLFWVKNEHGVAQTHVGCNCKRHTNKAPISMGAITTVADAWTIYNDAANHDESVAVFSDDLKGGAYVLSQKADLDRQTTG